MQKLFTFTMLAAVAGDTGNLNNALIQFGNNISGLMSTIWPWLLGIGLTLIALWGAFIGVKIIKARKAEEKQEAKALVKQLIIGIVVIFLIALGGPLIIQGLASWAGQSITPIS
ncbi:MAG: hypothetical protein ACI4M5_03325 [Christensenellales bacterium]